MEILARYIHGSEDSTDLDVLYVADAQPTYAQCISFCTADPGENRNLCTISDQTVQWCFKGAEDEVNNALIATYPLHAQDFPLLIGRPVPRNLIIKLMSVLRKLLMELRYAGMNSAVHHALRKGFTERMELARKADLRMLSWTCSEAELMESRKRMAFQLGQAIGLYHGAELYTKKSIAEELPELKPYLYREMCAVDSLEEMRQQFLDILSGLQLEDAGGQLIVCTCQGKRMTVSLAGKEHVVTDGTVI